jgi:copper/silver efflux system protein
MVSSSLLTLIVIPAVYAIVKGWRLPSLMAERSAHAVA